LNRGTCTDSGGCICPENYQGDFCQNPKCKNGGVLNIPLPECKCSEIFEGPFCETCKCQNLGTCDGKNCNCLKNYEGKLCETRICEIGEHTEHDNECKCKQINDKGFCQKEKCENGQRDADGNCKCSEFFSGNLCETFNIAETSFFSKLTLLLLHLFFYEKLPLILESNCMKNIESCKVTDDFYIQADFHDKIRQRLVSI
jgi:hypothetical protein